MSLRAQFLTYSIFVIAYALIVSFGLYEIRRWKFYSSRAKYIADFTKTRLGNDKSFSELFCRTLEKQSAEGWYDRLLMKEWVAVGRAAKRPHAYNLFEHAELFFFMFCTTILAVLFIGKYNGDLIGAFVTFSFVEHPFFGSSVVIAVLYVLISIITGYLLKEISSSIK